MPSYIALIASNRFEDAINHILLDNPIPATLGRVCVHHCEDSCKRGEIDKPISICALKRFASDITMERLNKIQKISPVYAEKVAVVGSGPAGLTVAHDLALKGYPVTIFEELPVAGGMLAVGIPEYRLPRNVLNAEINSVLKLGVELKLNTKIGRDITIDDLWKQGYKAIFIGVGAHKGLKLNVEGEDDFQGFLDAAAFLRRVNLGDKTIPGEKVCVIGGGNTAVDAARTSLRLGSKEVHIVYRRQREQMPANPAEVDAAEHEGIFIDYLVAPVKILGVNGKVTGMECIRNELGEPDSSGRRRPVPIKGSEFIINSDVIIPAISQEPDLSFLPQNHGFEISKWSSFVVDQKTLQTNIAGIFAGGDAVSGPATVVEAVAAGQRAAVSIDCYLQGLTEFSGYKAIRPRMRVPRVELKEEDEKSIRPQMAELSVEERVRNFIEVEFGFDRETAVREAKRCLRCDIAE